MHKLQIFRYYTNEIRTILKDNEPWFVANDVCKVLEISNARDALNRLDEDERDDVGLTDTIGRMQITNIVNEPGLYTLILGSRKPEAKTFKRWITHEVIPSIRKHGIYATAPTIDRIIADPDYGITLLMELKAERKKSEDLELANAVQRQQIAEMNPKATYYDLILQNKSTVKISVIAKDYGMSAKKFNALLNEYGIQFKQGNIWLLYQKYADQGYTQSRTYAVDAEKSVMYTYWTQKGRLFLYHTLKAKGILPLIEKA